MDSRKIIKVGNSIAVTLPPTFGFVVGDSVVVSKVGNCGSLIITKIPELQPQAD